MTTLPILWTFRRCPYAMRARLAIQSSGQQVVLQEILLKDKPAPFLAASPKGTVPVVQDGSTLIEQSRDVMLWALGRNDPEGWLDMPDEGHALMDTCDGPFKSALDHTKYAVRYPDREAPALVHRPRSPKKNRHPTPCYGNFHAVWSFFGAKNDPKP